MKRLLAILIVGVVMIFALPATVQATGVRNVDFHHVSSDLTPWTDLELWETSASIVNIDGTEFIRVIIDARIKLTQLADGSMFDPAKVALHVAARSEEYLFPYFGFSDADIIQGFQNDPSRIRATVLFPAALTADLVFGITYLPQNSNWKVGKRIFLSDYIHREVFNPFESAYITWNDSSDLLCVNAALKWPSEYNPSDNTHLWVLHSKTGSNSYAPIGSGFLVWATLGEISHCYTQPKDSVLPTVFKFVNMIYIGGSGIPYEIDDIYLCDRLTEDAYIPLSCNIKPLLLSARPLVLRSFTGKLPESRGEQLNKIQSFPWGDTSIIRRAIDSGVIGDESARERLESEPLMKDEGKKDIDDDNHGWFQKLFKR